MYNRLPRLIGLLTLILLTTVSGVQAERSLIYFYTPTCSSCMQTRDFLNSLENSYSDLEIKTFNTSKEDIQILLEEYGEKYGLTEDYIGIVPAVFYGDNALVGLGNIKSQLPELLKSPQQTAEIIDVNTVTGNENIIHRFKSFSIGTICLAGLIDGINPCAFSTLIFFISFLIVTGQNGKKILYVGGSFTLGIFISYLLIGWGIFCLLNVLQTLTTIARWVYPITAILVTILVVISFFDYLKVLQKKSSKVVLTLPKKIVHLINLVVQKLIKLRYIIPVSFITGFLLSFLEFLCTGQIYLPTIVYITGINYLKVKALFYLIIYNISFILPMVVIFVAAYKTNTSQKVSEYLNTRLKGIKLAITGLFTLLAIFMWVLTLKYF